MTDDRLFHAYPVHSDSEEWDKHEDSFDCWCVPDRDSRHPNLVLHRNPDDPKRRDGHLVQ